MFGLQTILQRASHRFARKLAARCGRTWPQVLQQKRLYVLPTGFGFALAVMLLVCILGALNYNNNLALGFAFVFSALAFLSAHIAHSNLLRISIQNCIPLSAHAGSMVSVGLLMDPGAQTRSCLQAQFEGSDRIDFELTQAQTVSMPLATQQRGWQDLLPITISTRWPFGVFVVWTYLWPEEKVLVYPALEESPPKLPIEANSSDGIEVKAGDEDLRYLREYRSGDSPRRIAWKASARGDELLTRELESPRGKDLLLDYQALASLDHEARLSRLATWCVMANQQGLNYALQLPKQQLDTGQGDAHLEACLRMLGAYP